jgi:hypothetical protein
MGSGPGVAACFLSFKMGNMRYYRVVIASVTSKHILTLNNLEVWLPITLLALKFLLKLFVDQTATAPILAQATYSLPVDIVFIAASFGAAFTLASPNNTGRGLIHVLVFIVAAVIVVVLWRRCSYLFDRSRYVLSATIFVLNTGLSSATLVVSIALLNEVHH